MIQLIIYGICALIFFKGVEILLLMLLTEPVKSWRKWTIVIGVVGFLLAAFFAIAIAYQGTLQALEIDRALRPLMR